MHAHQKLLAASATLTVAALSFALPARAGDVIYGDFAARYLQRSDTIFPGSGDAKDVNAATQVIDPWPRHSANRHIPGNGERMSGAVQRYRDVSKLPLAPQPIAPVNIESTGVSGSSAMSSGTK